jgi:uncharacterized membrane protein YciS (DUF1049 family)
MLAGMSHPDFSQPPVEKQGAPWRLIALGVLAVVTVGFILQNRNETEITFLFFFDVTARVWTSLVVAVALGVVLDRLFASWWRRRRDNDRDRR